MKSKIYQYNHLNIKKLNQQELIKLCNKLREYIIKVVDKQGGHLSSNLGIIELVVSVLYNFDIDNDKLLFDVGHQAYAYKILTNRDISNIRTKQGVSGFTKYSESKYDYLESGHAGTCLSAMMGYLLDNKIQNNNSNKILGIIGDGSLESGMTLEGLNLMAYNKLPGIIIINHNQMSISKSVGSISDILNDYEKSKTFFSNLGYNFYYCKDGNDVNLLNKYFSKIKNNNLPTIFLVDTKKGLGLNVLDKDGFNHTIIKNDSYTTTELVSDLFIELNKNNYSFLVEPAMLIGSKFLKFSNLYPNRYIDVGISEELAATMSGILAKSGVNVFVNYYSTFSQRAFDQIINDISRPGFNVKFLIDRANILPFDGETHQGIYDLNIFGLINDAVILEPYDYYDYIDLLNYTFYNNKITVFRYPRRKLYFEIDKKYKAKKITKKWLNIKNGEKLNIISYGEALDRIVKLNDKYKLDLNIINARFLKPIDEKELLKIFNNNLNILIYEENYGYLYNEVLKFKEKNNFLNKIFYLNLKDQKIIVGNKEEIIENTTLSEKKLLETIENASR